MGASLAIFGGAAYYGATGAFFSDAETSSGNTFTAGSIDLSLGSGFSSANNNVNGSGTVALDPNNNGRSLFTFTDLKPGDEGTVAFKLNVTSNESYACALADTGTNADNGVNDPETAAGDTTDGAGNGELQNHLQLATFADLNNNSAYDSGEPINVNQYTGDSNGFTFAEVAAAGWVPVADASSPNTWLTIATLTPATTYSAGMLYCFGNFTTTGTGAGMVVTGCDGSASNLNDAQTDSMSTGITFESVQTRNNPGFLCSSLAAPVVAPTVVSVTADSLAATAASPTGWYLYDDQSDTIQTDSVDHGFVAGPSTPPVGTGSVHFTKTTNDKFGIATNQFIGTHLNTLGSLMFSTYRTSGTSAQAPSLGFDIDSNTADADTSYQGRLTYEPYFTHTVNTGAWQDWDTQDNFGAGNWWFSHASLSGAAASVCTQANPCTWSEMLAAYPNIAISGRTIIRTNGADGEAADMNADKLVMKIGANTTTYNFGN